MIYYSKGYQYDQNTFVTTNEFVVPLVDDTRGPFQTTLQATTSMHVATVRHTDIQIPPNEIPIDCVNLLTVPILQHMKLF